MRTRNLLSGLLVAVIYGIGVAVLDWPAIVMLGRAVQRIIPDLLFVTLVFGAVGIVVAIVVAPIMAALGRRRQPRTTRGRVGIVTPSPGPRMSTSATIASAESAGTSRSVAPSADITELSGDGEPSSRTARPGLAAYPGADGGIMIDRVPMSELQAQVFRVGAERGRIAGSQIVNEDTAGARGFPTLQDWAGALVLAAEDGELLNLVTTEVPPGPFSPRDGPAGSLLSGTYFGAFVAAFEQQVEADARAILWSWP
jgi:hypothetical protein